MVSPYISDPWGAVQTVIDGGKSKLERVHAGLGVVDFAAVTFLPQIEGENPPMMAAGSEEDLVAKLSDCCPPAEGVAAVQFPWQTVLPIVMALLRKWLKF